MIRANSRWILALVCYGILPAGARAGEPSAMSPMEALVYKLASADLVSEPHPMPSSALLEFAQRSSSDFILRAENRAFSRIITVRQPGCFEFIHAESDEFVMRQLYRIMLFGIKPTAADWRDHPETAVLAFLRANVRGTWDTVQVELPYRVNDLVFLQTLGGVTSSVGTCYDSFVAVVLNDMIWIGLPKTMSLATMNPFSANLEQNSRWFAKANR